MSCFPRDAEPQDGPVGPGTRQQPVLILSLGGPRAVHRCRVDVLFVRSLDSEAAWWDGKDTTGF